jgi:cysteine synthase
MQWPALPAVLSSWRSHLPTPRTARHVLYGILFGVSLSIASASIASSLRRKRERRLERTHGFEPRPIELRADETVQGVLGLIGNTPLVRIASLSDALGVEILGKAEWLNPGGSVKDRVALKSAFWLIVYAQADVRSSMLSFYSSY